MTLVVIGASAVDVTSRVKADVHDRELQFSNTTTPGSVSLTLGGVARNVAEAAHRILSAAEHGDSDATLLLSPIGDDDFANVLQHEHRLLNMREDGFIQLKGETTAVCNIFLNASGGLIGGVADMDIVRSTPPEPVRVIFEHFTTIAHANS